MNGRKTLLTFLAGSAAPALLGLGFLLGRARGTGPEAGGEEAKAAVVAAVQVAPMKHGRLEGRSAAFGSIVASPGSSRSLSVPYECRVVSIAVREGQAVGAGELLATVQDSPDALLALDQARADFKADEIMLRQVQDRHALKLADNAQLAQARQAFDAAQLRLKSFEARRMGSLRALRSSGPGVITRVAAQAGAILSPSTPLLEQIDPSRLEAKVGLEPTTAVLPEPGSVVELSDGNGEGSQVAKGRLKAVSPAVDPATRLRTAYVSLPPRHGFLVGQFVRARLASGSRDGIIVPYASVLPTERGGCLFTVRKGRAVRHEVRILVEGRDQVQVEGEGLDPAEPVVVQGNYELEEGMAVRIEEPGR